MSLRLQPITISNAKEYVARWHRHHEPPVGALFALACSKDQSLEPCGVAIIGRPKARHIQDGKTCEVVRVATDGTANACSFLYGAAKRAAKALGYSRCITYTLVTENGASLRAVEAVESGRVVGASWHSPSRPRVLRSAAQLQDKIRWDLFNEANG